MEVEYVQKSKGKLKNRHKYVVKVIEPHGHIYAYEFKFIYDITDDEDVNFTMYYSSEISIKRYFKYDRLDCE